MGRAPLTGSQPAPRRRRLQPDLVRHRDQAGNYKGGFGFYPLLCSLDETAETLAGILRPGNAGSNTAQDQIDCVELALEQLPAAVREEAELLFRADSAGLVHKLLEHLHGQDVRFSVGMDMTEDVRQAVLAIADEDLGRGSGSPLNRALCIAVHS